MRSGLEVGERVVLGRRPSSRDVVWYSFRRRLVDVDAAIVGGWMRGCLPLDQLVWYEASRRGRLSSWLCADDVDAGMKLECKLKAKTALNFELLMPCAK